MEKEFYQVVEEIYRKRYFNGQRALIKVTDICVDDLTQAKVYAYGYVANRVFTQKKLQEKGVLPGEGLAAFFSATVDTDFETLYRTYLIGAAKKELAMEGKPHDYFEESDRVIWQIDLVMPGDSPKYTAIYDSSNDSGDIDDLLKKVASEAIVVGINSES